MRKSMSFLPSFTPFNTTLPFSYSSPSTNIQTLRCEDGAPYSTHDQNSSEVSYGKETFQAMIGGRFAPLTIMSNKDTDIDSMVSTFNAAVTETASEILGKHRQKKKPWITAEILVT